MGVKIFYAVQATGNGHISRAVQLLPYLQAFGEVDILLSGANATLTTQLPVKYRSKGMSLYYAPKGGLDYKKMFFDNNLIRAFKDAADLPIENYDFIINDFECITALACKKKRIASVQFGHQASFKSQLVPRPEKKQLLGEYILAKYAPATNYIGLHFKRYDDFIFPPVIKTEILQAEVKDEGHITVYLSAYSKQVLEPVFKSLHNIHFHWFLPDIKSTYREKNITYYPVSLAAFNQSMIQCTGIITGAGFETPAEGLYLGKKLLCIPIGGQYEQLCNAAALSKMGVSILKSANTNHFAQDILQWMQLPKIPIEQATNPITETLQYLFDTYPSPNFKH